MHNEVQQQMIVVDGQLMFSTRYRKGSSVANFLHWFRRKYPDYVPCPALIGAYLVVATQIVHSGVPGGSAHAHAQAAGGDAAQAGGGPMAPFSAWFRQVHTAQTKLQEVAIPWGYNDAVKSKTAMAGRAVCTEGLPTVVSRDTLGEYADFCTKLWASRKEPGKKRTQQQQYTDNFATEFAAWGKGALQTQPLLPLQPPSAWHAGTQQPHHPVEAGEQGGAPSTPTQGQGQGAATGQHMLQVQPEDGNEGADANNSEGLGGMTCWRLRAKDMEDDAARPHAYKTVLQVFARYLGTSTDALYKAQCILEDVLYSNLDEGHLALVDESRTKATCFECWGTYDTTDQTEKAYHLRKARVSSHT